MRPHPILIGVLSLALAACAGLPPNASTKGAADLTVSRSARVVLHPKLTPSRGIQAVVSPYTAMSIEQLVVVPHVAVSLEDGTHTFYPLKASTGQVLYPGIPGQALEVGQSSPSLDLTRPIVLNNLKHMTLYRFCAQAFNASGELISDDSASYVEMSVADDDRPTIGDLPIKLIDRPFAGSTTVALAATGAASRVKKMTTCVFTVSADGSEVAVPDTAASASHGLHPDTVTLGYLRPNTTYRVKAEALDFTDAILATGSADVVVTDDDTPAPVTLTLEIPELPPPS